MAKQLTDDEASLKRKARRRLIGAVALTTVIVVLLPMLLDSEPRPVGQDIELRIPDKDKVGEFVPKIGLSPASAPAAALPAPTPTPAIADTAVAASQVVAAKVPESKPVPAPKKPDATVPKQAPAKPESKPAEQTQAEPQQGFVVQVGAFTKAESAHYLQKKLSKEGFKVYTEKTGDKTRVRAGPYATREAADKVLHKLEAQGLHPVVSPAQ
ncbi:MAG: SPOR domain-containing protein [Betaproteobacteria bacterium]|nr:SPOR domain-containing protein [Betaproteobacteria bacterium]